MLVAYAAANAVLYSALLPLWEGFDEPFHFGYVQQLANGRGLVDLPEARLSNEVSDSLLCAPVSSTVKVNLPGAVTYERFFSWTPQRRARQRERENEIPHEGRWGESAIPNYEAHQAPLAYLVLAAPERLILWVALPRRVLLLRIVAALAGAALLGTGAAALCRELELGEPYRSIVLFCLFSWQMTWATLAHVANDWLAVPLAVWALVFTIRCAVGPTTANVIAASLLISAGLLTKAYFLALEPLVLAVCAVRGGWRGLGWHAGIVAVCAAPWYIRNQVLYGTLSGMQEARLGFGPGMVLGAVPHLWWPKIALDSSRFALWMGNNTFRPLSTKITGAVILTLAAGQLLWAVGRHKTAERVAAAYCGSWLLALAYAAALAHVATYGASSTPSPWYAQVLTAPLLALALLGAARRGRFVAAGLALLLGLVAVVTYVFRLIPIYGGMDGRGSVGMVANLYGARFGELVEKLGAAALGPVWLILGLTATVLVLAAFLEWQLIRQTLRASPSAPTLRRGPASL